MKKSLQEIYANGIKSDKGTLHSYIPFYEEALKEYRETKNTFIEVGIYKGESIRMWRKYFSNANIYGFDIREYGAPTGNYKLRYQDATIESSFKWIRNIEIVIDDGEHTLEQQLKTFNILYPKLIDGGIYFIEDVVDIDNTKETFLSLSPSVKIHDFRELSGVDDDIIIEIRK